MAWVWSNSTSAPVDRLVLLAIADCANDDGAEAYPSMSRLAGKTGLSVRSVQRSINQLSADGELVVHRNGGPKGCNRYRVTMTPGTVSPPSESHPVRESPRQADIPSESRGRGDSVTPHPRQPVTSTPVSLSPETSLNHPLTVLEPSGAQQIIAEWIERCAKRPPKSVIGQMAKQVGALLEEGFDPDDVRRGVAHWMTKDLHPSVLPSIVNGVVNGSPNGRASPRESVTDQRVQTGLEVGKRLAARLARGEIEP